MKVASKELQKQAYPSFGLKFFFLLVHVLRWLA